MGKKVNPKLLGLGKLTVENTEEISVGRVLNAAIDKYGVRAVLNRVGFICINEGMPYVATTLQLLATEKKAELVEGMVVLLYVRDHWDKLLKGEAKDYFTKVCKRTKAKFRKMDKRG